MTIMALPVFVVIFILVVASVFVFYLPANLAAWRQVRVHVCISKAGPNKSYDFAKLTSEDLLRGWRGRSGLHDVCSRYSSADGAGLRASRRTGNW